MMDGLIEPVLTFFPSYFLARGGKLEPRECLPLLAVTNEPQKTAFLDAREFARLPAAVVFGGPMMP